MLRPARARPNDGSACDRGAPYRSPAGEGLDGGLATEVGELVGVRTASAPWGIAAIGLSFLGFFFLTNTSYWDPAASWTCARTPVHEVLAGKREVSFVDPEGRRQTTANPCLEPARGMVAIGAPIAAVAAVAGTIAFRKRTPAMSAA